MNLTKKLLLAVVSLGLVASAYAAPGSANTRRDQRGNEANPWYGGYANTRLLSTTAEQVVCSGRCLLAGLILNTGPQASQVRIRNSSVANGVGVIVLKHHYSIANTSPGNNPVQLPLDLDKGITVQLTAVSNQEEVVVLYIDMDNP